MSRRSNITSLHLDDANRRCSSLLRDDFDHLRKSVGKRQARRHRGASNTERRTIVSRLNCCTNYIRKNNNNDTNPQKEEITTYDERNHLQVMFQLEGSVWPEVLPYCLTNTASAAVLWYSFNKRGVHFDISQDANGYMASLLSFLVVSRVRMIYNQTMFSRDCLMKLCKSSEELIQTAALLTAHNDSILARKWRDDLAYMTILLLKQTMCALRNHSELLKIGAKDLTADAFNRDTEYFQKPNSMAYQMRKHIMKIRLCDKLKGRMLKEKAGKEEFKLIGYIDQYTAAFNDLEGLARTRFPFPIVQMARTILVIWLMFLPFGLVHNEYPLWGICMLIFLLTFGFLGLEYVSVGMDDPFGTDATDFDVFFLAEITFEHIYVMIFNVDGQDAVDGLMRKVKKPDTEDVPL
mmetsp:Transcript_12554/g.14723  ORF Transcript_12554/g.14723 Transcript_12554/m.14723 type:complete len:407 (+) Transcript_12554:61-1281(+)